jgi:hypothetical protein
MSGLTIGRAVFRNRRQDDGTMEGFSMYLHSLGRRYLPDVRTQIDELHYGLFLLEREIWPIVL